MMAANKVKGIRCGVCVDTFSARMIRQHNDANMLSIGVRAVGEGLALDIVDAFLTAQFEGSVKPQAAMPRPEWMWAA
jgi:ribose 5-phosphate isomerase B